MNKAKNILGDCWEIFKKNWKQMTVFALIFSLLTILFTLLDESLQANKFYSDYLASLANLIVSSFLALGAIRVSLLFYNNKPVNLGHFFNNWKIFGKYMLASLLKSLTIISPVIVWIMIGGIAGMQREVLIALGAVAICLCVFLAISFAFTDYFIIDKDAEIIAAFKKSWATTKGAKMRLLLMFLGLVILNLIGFAAVLVGLLVTIPLTWLIMVRAYKTLSKK